LLMIEILTVAIAVGLMALIRKQRQELERAQCQIEALEWAIERLESESSAGGRVDTSTL